MMKKSLQINKHWLSLWRWEQFSFHSLVFLVNCGWRTYFIVGALFFAKIGKM